LLGIDIIILNLKNMKTIIVGHLGWPGMWTENVVDSFRELGINVRVIADYIFSNYENLRDVIDKKTLNQRLINEVLDFSPNLILLLKGERILAETLNKIHSINSQIHIATWWCDDPLVEWRSHDMHEDALDKFKEYDTFFISDSYYIPYLRRWDVKTVYLPLAYSNGTLKYKNMNKLSYIADISFVGQPDNNRNKIIEALREFDTHVWGTGWTLDGITLHKPTKPDETYKIYASSKISLCINRKQLINGVDLRAFDVPACGCMLISTHQKDITSLYEVGKEVETFQSISELKEKIRYYLKNPEECLKIASEGYNKAHSCHSYKHRLEKILKSIRM